MLVDSNVLLAVIEDPKWVAIAGEILPLKFHATANPLRPAAESAAVHVRPRARAK